MNPAPPVTRAFTNRLKHVMRRRPSRANAGLMPAQRRAAGAGRIALPAPMDAAELAFAGAARQAELIRAREVSARELVQLYLDRIERLDPQLNAYRVVFAERARGGRLRPTPAPGRRDAPAARRADRDQGRLRRRR